MDEEADRDLPPEALEALDRMREATGTPGIPSPWAGMRRAALGGVGRSLRRRLVPIVAAVVVLVIVFAVTVGASLPDDGASVAVSNADALSFVEKLTGSAQGASKTRSVSITVTQEEVTSFLSIAAVLSSQLQQAGGTGDLGELAQLDDAAAVGQVESVDRWQEAIASQGGIGSVLTRGLDLRLTIRDPEVRFTEDGVVIVRGYGKLAFLSVPARVAVRPVIEDGQLRFAFVEGQFGRLPLPGGIANLVADGIERALLAGQSFASVDMIQVGQGSLTFSGSVTR